MRTNDRKRKQQINEKTVEKRENDKKKQLKIDKREYD